MHISDNYGQLYSLNDQIKYMFKYLTKKDKERNKLNHQCKFMLLQIFFTCRLSCSDF